MSFIESMPGRARGVFGKLKDYMLAPPRDPSAVIGEDGEPLPDLVPDSSDPRGYREAVAPRDPNLPKTRLADFAGRFGAVGGIIPTHGASGAQQFFTGLMGSMQANQNRDLMLAQQARADRQQWLQRQQALSDAANQYQRNQIAEQKQKHAEEQADKDFEQRQKMNAATIATQEANAAAKRQDTAREFATQTRPVERGDVPQRMPSIGMIPGGALDLGLAANQGSIAVPQGGGPPRVWMSDADIKARDKLAAEKAQRRYPMPKALADQFAPGSFDPNERFTDEELQHLHAYVQSPDKNTPHYFDRIGGGYVVTMDPKTNKPTVQKIEGLPGKDPREFAPQHDRIEIVYQNGKAYRYNKDTNEKTLIPDSDGMSNRPDNKRRGGFGNLANSGGGGAAPPMPLRLSQTDVGKTYTDKNGKRRKVTAVNPQNPTQYKSEAVD